MEAYSKGQSLLEVVVALTLISVILITLVAMASLSIRSSAFSKNQSEASRYTQEAVEWLQQQKDVSWSTLLANAGTTNWCLDSGTNWNVSGTCANGDVISGTPFQRSLVFSGVGANSITATVNTYWSDSQGKHAAPATVVFTNWK